MAQRARVYALHALTPWFEPQICMVPKALPRATSEHQANSTLTLQGLAPKPLPPSSRSREKDQRSGVRVYLLTQAQHCTLYGPTHSSSDVASLNTIALQISSQAEYP